MRKAVIIVCLVVMAFSGVSNYSLHRGMKDLSKGLQSLTETVEQLKNEVAEIKRIMSVTWMSGTKSYTYGPIPAVPNETSEQFQARWLAGLQQQWAKHPPNPGQ